MSTAESRRKAKEEYLKLLQQQKESATAANGAANAILQSEEKVQATDTSANRREQILAEKRKAFFEGKHVDNVKPIIPSTENYIDRRQQIRPPIPESSNSNQARVSDWKKMGFPSEYAYAHHLGLLENGTSKAEISIDRKVSSIDHPHFPPDSSQLEEASRIVIKNGDTSSSGVTGSDGKGEIVDKVSYGGKGNDEKEARRMKQAEYAKLLNEQISHDKQRLLEVNLPVIKENDEAKMDELVGGGGLQIGFQSQLDKDAKRRQQMEYADALQRDQYKRQQHSIGVREEETRADRGRDFGERLDRNGSSQTGWNQGGHRNNGSDQALYRAQEVGEGEGARWERREKREDIGGGGVSGVGMMIGSEVSKEEKRARQAEYARALDFQRDRSNVNVPEASRFHVKLQEPRLAEDHHTMGPSSILNLGGDISDKQKQKQKQKEYAMALKQQMERKDPDLASHESPTKNSSFGGWHQIPTLHNDTSIAMPEQARNPPPGQQRNTPQSKPLSSNELGPGWVMGPLGVPVRKTLEVGNRGVQKAFLEHVHHQSNSPPKPLSSSPQFSEYHLSSAYPTDLQGNPSILENAVAPGQLLPGLGYEGENRRKVAQMKQMKALEEQIRLNKQRQEMEQRKKEEEEQKEQLRIEKELKEINDAYQREQQVAKMKAAEDNKRQLQLQIEQKKMEKLEQERKDREKEAEEAVRIEKERQEMIRREQLEQQRELQQQQQQQQQQHNMKHPAGAPPDLTRASSQVASRAIPVSSQRSPRVTEVVSSPNRKAAIKKGLFDPPHPNEELNVLPVFPPTLPTSPALERSLPSSSPRRRPKSSSVSFLEEIVTTNWQEQGDPLAESGLRRTLPNESKLVFPDGRVVDPSVVTNTLSETASQSLARSIDRETMTSATVSRRGFGIAEQQTDGIGEPQLVERETITTPSLSRTNQLSLDFGNDASADYRSLTSRPNTSSSSRIASRPGTASSSSSSRMKHLLFPSTSNDEFPPDESQFNIERELKKNQRKWHLLQKLNNLQASEMQIRDIFNDKLFPQSLTPNYQAISPRTTSRSKSGRTKSRNSNHLKPSEMSVVAHSGKLVIDMQSQHKNEKFQGGNTGKDASFSEKETIPWTGRSRPQSQPGIEDDDLYSEFGL